MIGIIAGTGRLPFHACSSLLAQKKNFLIIVLFPEDNGAELQKTFGSSVEIIAEQFYKPSTILNTLKQKKVSSVLLIGKVDKRNLFSHVKFDFLALKMLTSLISKSDSSIMEYIINEFKKHDIEIISQSSVLGMLMIPPGVISGTLTKEMHTNIQLGITMATKLSEYDIGQTVIVKDNMVLAVEAIEGTDECIKRGIALGKSNVIICKAARKNQNQKFDLPTLGPQSLNQITNGQVAAIAWLSKATFISDQEKFIEQAQSLGITLVSYDELKSN